MAGAWTMNDDGQFVLDPAYEEKLNDIKSELRTVWVDKLCTELAASSSYTKEELAEEFYNRISKSSQVNPNPEAPVDIVDSFILESLEGSF